MFSKILDCPKCGESFSYEHEGSTFPDKITCPHCNTDNEYSNYSALTFCTECRSKLKVPLDILFDPDITCPQCGFPVKYDATVCEDATTFVPDGADTRQLYRRMLKDGEMIDKYKVIRMLGKGGMAEVYLAEHLLLKKKCALKIMRSSMNNDDPVYIKRFMREAKLTHQFNHPNIVRVFDVGSDFKTGYLFIAMEYLEGQTLVDIAKDKQFSEEDLVAVLKAMCSALKVLAESNVVHRDIKPSNIMKTRDGVYKLMDLGIAKSENNHQAGEMTLTIEQSTIGTPSYASPEQCQNAHSADVRSDIYCLGATLYHIASGKLPFEGKTVVEIILKVMQDEPEPLKNVRSDLSRKMINIIEQMMKKRPEERPATPDEVLAMLEADDKLNISEVMAVAVGDVKKSWFVRFFLFMKKLVAPEGASLKSILWRSGALVAVLLLLGVLGCKWSVVMGWLEDSDNKDFAPGAVLYQKRQEMFPFGDRKELTVYQEKQLPGKLVFYQDGIATYPLVNINSFAEKEGFVASYDFHKNRQTGKHHFVFSHIRDKALLLDGKYPHKPGNNTYAEFMTNAVELNDLDEKHFTVSLGMFVEKDFNGIVLAMGENALKLIIRNGKFFFIIGDSFVDTQVDVPYARWFNISFAADMDKRRLSMLSEDRLLGVWNLPETISPIDKMLFYDVEASKAFNGKISMIMVRNFAIDYEVPNRLKREPVPVYSKNSTLRESLLMRIDNLYKLAAEEAAKHKHKQEMLQRREALQKNAWIASPLGSEWNLRYEDAAENAKYQEKPLLVLLVDSSDDITNSIVNNLLRDRFADGIGKDFVFCYIDCGNRQMPQAQQEYVKEKLKQWNIDPQQQKLPAIMLHTCAGHELVGFTPLVNAAMPLGLLQNARQEAGLRHKLTHAALHKLDLRLEKVKLRLHELQDSSLPDNRKKQSYLKKQITTLQQAIDARNNIDSAAGKTYDDSATGRFAEKFNKYLTALSGRTAADDQSNDCSELLDLLKNNSVDPNVEVEVNNSNIDINGKITVLDAALNMLFGKNSDKFIKLLQTRGADPDLVRRRACDGLFTWMLDFPCNDIDSPIMDGQRLQAPVFYLAKALHKPDLLKAGVMHDTSYLRKFLLLAPNVNGVFDDDNRTLMHYAVAADDPLLMDDLVCGGFTDWNVKDKNGRTPWSLALQLHSVKARDFMLRNKFNTETEKSDLLQYEFCGNILKRRYSSAVKNLQDGASAEQIWGNGLNALQNACATNDRHLVKVLLDNAVSMDNHVPEIPGVINRALAIAIINNNFEMFKLLLARGADPAAAVYLDKNSRTMAANVLILHALQFDRSSRRALNWLDFLLKNTSGFNINSEVDGRSLLSTACTAPGRGKKRIRHDIIRFLLDHGASVKTRSGRDLSKDVRDPAIKQLLEKK